jgi:small-conductance mechanosensitive channel
MTKKRSYRTVVAISLNVIWGIFLFWFLFEFDDTLFFAIVPFLVVALSLNFKKIINNMVSGALLLSSDQFDIGDLIETNEIQGIVTEINLNYTKIRQVPYSRFRIVVDKFNEICAKYGEIFGIRPRFHVIEITVKFRILTLDSNNILNYQPEFAKELYKAILSDIDL